LATSAGAHHRISSSPARLLLFWLLIVGCVALFFIPAFVIRPFSYQSPRALMVAMAVRQYAPVLTVIFLLAAVWLCVSLWRAAGATKKALLGSGLLLAFLCTVMSRIDYFEWMFHPLPSPGFNSVADAKLDPKQMVMAVRFGNDARAYPIRAMAYHHLVNDVVAGVPLLVTY
jgi:Protein of unknown function (DUF3179)